MHDPEKSDSHSLSYQPTTCASPHLACEGDPTVFDFDLDNFAVKARISGQQPHRAARKFGVAHLFSLAI
jgi:hypothetical protein